jgi:hypothetical protein
MRTKVNCPECGKELDSVGLKGHRYYAHQIPYQSVNNSANADILPTQNTAKSVNLAVLADLITDTLSERIGLRQEANTAIKESDSKEHNAEDCPECRRREFKIVDLEHELLQAQKSNVALQEQINANNDRPLEIPDLTTVIQHCESGEWASHAKQWDQIKARIVQNAYDSLPPEAIPDKVVESEGLKRGFIPKKMIIPIIR